MKYRVEDYIDFEKCHSYSAQNERLIDECQFLSESFSEIDRLDRDTVVLARQAIAAYIAGIRRLLGLRKPTIPKKSAP